MQSSTQFKDVAPASSLLNAPQDILHRDWSVDALAGRFVEVSGDAAGAALTVSAALIHEVQQRGELAAWIGATGSTFYPPDFAASGVDLDALPVVRVADMAKASRVADTLIRSGGFALVVLDIGRKLDLPFAMQTRLVGLAKQHHTALLALTRRTVRDAPASSLVSLRVETERKRIGHDCFLCELRVVKDKRRIPGWNHTEICHGPDGLC
ncbi:MAG: recombinase A [Candidatus Hydrogenedentes bacterium]|nr:recombinase A [Candidatus Hydrogenedentota bacterium]